MTHLLLVALGPVQGLIASARRTHDLWLGSWMVSELAKAAARAIAERDGNGALIFPAPTDLGDLRPALGDGLSAPNRILAWVKGPPSDVAFAAECAARKRMDEMAKQAFDKIKPDSNEGAPLWDRAHAERQVKDLLEWYWVAYPCAEPAAYVSARRTVDALMAARKTTRVFQPPAWAAPIPKSSLDGQRESVIAELAYAGRDASADERAAHARQLYRCFRARPAERLSGVDLLKRLGGHDAQFPSTSAIAARPLLSAIAADEERLVGRTAAWRNYVQDLKDRKSAIRESLHTGRDEPVIGTYDPSLLYEGRLDDFFAPPDDVKAARKALGKCIETFTAGHIPPTYYALLLADGDHMGALLDALHTADEHREASQTLAAFAASARTIVERQHRGALVYSGGDDVMAFVPLDAVLACARELAHRFREKIDEIATKAANGTTEGMPQPTLSVGVAIAHHLDPLGETLELARSAEKKAKASGRNALAITLAKRSGAPRTVVGRWGSIDARLSQLVAWYKADALPHRAAFDLQDLSLRLSDHPDLQLAEARRMEAGRLMERKRARRGSDEVAEEITNQLEAWLSDESVSVGQLSEEMIIAKALAEAASWKERLESRPGGAQ